MEMLIEQWRASTVRISPMLHDFGDGPLCVNRFVMFENVRTGKAWTFWLTCLGGYNYGFSAN